MYSPIMINNIITYVDEKFWQCYYVQPNQHFMFIFKLFRLANNRIVRKIFGEIPFTVLCSLLPLDTIGKSKCNSMTYHYLNLFIKTSDFL